MTNRTDIHRPTELVTEDYEYIGGYDHDPEFDSPHNRMMKYQMVRLLAHSKTARYGDGSQCDHCGAHIRYVGVMKHLPSGDHIAVGETCLGNRFDRATEEFQAMRRTAQLNREQHRIMEAWKAYRDFHTDVDWETLDASENQFIRDVLARGRQYGELTPRQLSAVQKAIIRDQERVEEEAIADLIPKTPVVAGDGLNIEATVLGTKTTYYRNTSQLKMLVEVETPDGTYKLWGSVPKGIEVERGDRFTMIANVQKSDDDEFFGFFKRPRQAAILSREEG